MKDQSIGKLRITNKGFASLEILIAFTILILCISAVIMVTFGNQSIAVDSEISNEAISKAQALLEKARADSKQDFNLVNPYTLTETSGSLTFAEKLDVIQNDLFTKKVTSTVSWQTDNKELSTIFTTLLTNPEAENGGDTCSSVLSGDWKNPEIETWIKDFGQLIGDSSGIYSISGIDAYKNRLYITVNSTTQKNDQTFFVFDISDPTNPILLGKLDDAKSTKSGLTAVRVAENKSNGKIYAYTASARSISEADDFGQLQIIDVSNPSLDSWNPTIIHFPIPGVGGTGTGNSVFYKDGYVYMGLVSTGGNGPEFHIIDVGDPNNPTEVGNWPPDGNSLGHAINSILIKNNYAYLATPDSNQEIVVLYIKDFKNPSQTSAFNALGGGVGSGNGKSLYSVGDNLYFGRTVISEQPEFYILNNVDPINIQGNNVNPLTQEIGTSVDGMIVRDFLAFLLTKTQFQVWKIDQNVRPWTMSSYTSPLNLSASGSTVDPSLDCEGNYFYIGSNDKTNKGYLTIITSQ